MGRKKLDKDEQEIIDSFENDEWESVKNKKNVTKYQAIAQATLKKDKRVNIRISERDLELLQERALREGIPYQTLMSSVLHKYVTGIFSEKGV
jgi:predicted DNA binding CopG/RHH family protein